MGVNQAKQCCTQCCAYCCPDDSNKNEVKIKYQTPSETYSVLSKSGDSDGEVKPQLDSVLYLFSQPHSEFAVHPAMTSTDGEGEGTDVVSQQPHFRLHSQEASTSVESLPSLRTTDPVTTEPIIVYSLFYDVLRGSLTVYLREACNLKLRAKTKTLDSYAVAYLLPHQHEVLETPVVKDSLKPHYNHSFVFPGQPDMQLMNKQTLVLRLYAHYKYYHPSLIGEVRVMLEDADLFGRMVQNRINTSVTETPHEVVNSGDLLFSLEYSPEAGIRGTLLKAKNLRHRHHGLTRMFNPYIKVSLFSKDKKVSSWKSTVKKNTQAPTFQEQFLFDVSELDFADLRLELNVMDHDILIKDVLIGQVVVGPRVSGGTGSTHWEEMMSSPRKEISRWHEIALAAAHTL